MRLSENRVLAWIVLAVCVVGSVFGLGGASLARERTDALEVFYEGAADRDSMHCMSAYLERAFECARVMALEVQLLRGDDQALNELMNAFEPDAEADSYGSLAAFRNMRRLADEMYNDVYAADLTDAQRRDFKIAYDDFQGAVRLMEKDPYHELAAEFNDERNVSFVSQGVCRLLGIEPLIEGF